MSIAKRDIVETLLARGDHQRAIRADDELPEVIHPSLHGGLLSSLGLDLSLLLHDTPAPARRFSRSRPADRRRLAGRS